MEVVEVLTVVGQTLTPSAKGVLNNAAATTPNALETPSRPSAGLTPLVNDLRINASTASLPRDSETWEVLDEHNASLIEEERPAEAATDSASSNGTAGSKASVSSWKTAANGAALNEFASSECPETSSKQTTFVDHQDHSEEKPPPPRQHKSSFRSLASSIRRTASQAHRHLHKRTFSGSSVTTLKSPTVIAKKPRVVQSATLPTTPAKKRAFPTVNDEEPTEVLIGSTPDPNAQGTRRAVSTSSAPSHHRTSTIRLVTSPYAEEENWDADELPLTGPNSVAQIKKRVVSKGPPVILEPAVKVSKVYPELPTFLVNSLTPKSDKSVPGAFPGSPTFPQSPDAMDVDGDNLIAPKAVTASKSFVGSPSIIGATMVASPSKFVFGAGQQVSGSQFSDAGAKLLAEMQAKLGGSTFNLELLKGRKAEMSKLVTSNNNLGTGSGFGLSLGSSTAATDRFAAAHQKEFAKMRSISGTTAKLAETAEPAESGEAGKRKMATAKEAPAEASNKRTKTAPRVLNKLRDSVRGAPAKPAATPVRKRTSLKPESARKFALLRQKRASMAATTSETAYSSPDLCTSDGEYVLAGSKKSAMESIKNSATTRGGSLLKGSPMKSSPAKKLSSSASMTRKPIPDFGDLPPSTLEPIKDHSIGSARSSASSTGSLSRSLRSRNLDRIASDNSLNKTVTRKASSSNLRALSKSSSPRSLSKGGSPRSRAANIIGKGRPTGEPVNSSIPVRKPSAADSLRKTSSSDSLRASRLAASTSKLSAPTAASRARMQATVRPPASSNLRQSTRVVSSSKINSSAPTTTSFGSFAVSSPFGEATSRANVLGTGFHLGSPATKSSVPAVKSPLGPGVTISAPRPLVPRSSAARAAASSRAAMSPARRATLNAKSPLKSPAKHGYAARTRTRESGISALKSPGGDVNQRRAEIRAKQERFKEEKELRAMLGA